MWWLQLSDSHTRKSLVKQRAEQAVSNEAPREDSPTYFDRQSDFRSPLGDHVLHLFDVGYAHHLLVQEFLDAET